MTKPQLEKQIERNVCDYAHDAGMLVYKFTSPARAAVPDRLLVTQQGTVFFIEFKRPGGTATDNQLEEHKELRRKGMLVWVIDYFDKEFADWIFE